MTAAASAATPSPGCARSWWSGSAASPPSPAAPAEGVWDEGEGRSRDEIVIFEVMADTLDRAWWRDYRAALERRFRQEEIVVRARDVERL